MSLRSEKDLLMARLQDIPVFCIGRDYKATDSKFFGNNKHYKTQYVINITNKATGQAVIRVYDMYGYYLIYVYTASLPSTIPGGERVKLTDIEVDKKLFEFEGELGVY